MINNKSTILNNIQAMGSWARRINTLCSNLKTFLSKNLDQNMHKNALFFEKKTGKIAAALGAPPPNPRWPPAAGGGAPRLPSCFSNHLLYILFRGLLWR